MEFEFILKKNEETLSEKNGNKDINDIFNLIEKDILTTGEKRG